MQLLDDIESERGGDGAEERAMDDGGGPRARQVHREPWRGAMELPCSMFRYRHQLSTHLVLV